MDITEISLPEENKQDFTGISSYSVACNKFISTHFKAALTRILMLYAVVFVLVPGVWQCLCEVQCFAPAAP